jgi:single-strand DNA-binding protein
MSNQFTGTGNIGTAPTVRHVPSNGEQRAVAEMRVYFDRRVPKRDGGFEDKGGFWLTVAVWGTLAEQAAATLQKGARIQVAGSLRQETWNDKNTGAERSELRLTADTLSIDLFCVESVAFKKRGASGADVGTSSDEGHGGYPHEDIRF